MVRFSAKPKNEPRLLSFARAKRAQTSVLIKKRPLLNYISFGK
ncbi:MAG: hypothetical protein U5L45_22745 [Saprospiraceae bacterium]|nr:hypothetical protein [Saprospiraceae bacterium]